MLVRRVGLLLALAWCGREVVARGLEEAEEDGEEEGPGKVLKDDDIYDLVIYTSAFGEAYEALASQWCRSLDLHLSSRQLDLRRKVVVLTRSERIDGCDTVERVSMNSSSIMSEKERRLRIKTLKMNKLPYEARAYMWLDVDVRPVAEQAAWLRKLLRKIVTSQTTPEPFLRNKSIALTKTRKGNKYNGGVFLYADHSCVAEWEKEVRKGIVGTATGRDQPSLLKVCTSGLCDVVDLPEKTQGYFTTTVALKALLLPNRKASFGNVALLHFTGTTHGPKSFLMEMANADGLASTGAYLWLFFLIIPSLYLLFRTLIRLLKSCLKTNNKPKKNASSSSLLRLHSSSDSTSSSHKRPGLE